MFLVLAVCICLMCVCVISEVGSIQCVAPLIFMSAEILCRLFSHTKLIRIPRTVIILTSGMPRIIQDSLRWLFVGGASLIPGLSLNTNVRITAAQH